MDKYTKAVLTVIAVCLVIQTAKDVAFVEPAYANQVQKMAICREDGSECAGIYSAEWASDEARGGMIITYPQR